MKRAILGLCLLLMTFPTIGDKHQLPGSWQWVPQAYNSLPAAAAGLAAGASDRLPPTLIQTGDVAMPFVVFRFRFIDHCCSGQIDNLYYAVGTETQALAQYQAWLAGRHSHAGIVMTGRVDVAFAWITK